MYRPAKQQRPKRRRRTHWVLMVTLLVFAGFVFYQYGFTVRYIEVRGNKIRPQEEAIEASGIQMGMSLFSIKEDEIKKNLNASRYLQYGSMWKRILPGGIVLTITERVPYAKLTSGGHLLLLGEDGIIMENTHNIDMSVPVPEIVGMRVDRPRAGEYIKSSVAGQAKAAMDIVTALYREGIAGEIGVINIAVLDNVTMLTHSGVDIVMGNSEDLDQKIMRVKEALSQISTGGFADGGRLSVSSGIWADYSPP